MTDFYEILEIEPGANADQIRRAYYRMARLHHPDLKGTDGETGEVFLLIQEAYDTLSTPLRRQRYDEKRREEERNGPGTQAVMVDREDSTSSRGAAART